MDFNLDFIYYINDIDPYIIIFRQNKQFKLKKK